MGFLSKLFRGEQNGSTELSPTSELMDEDRYWRLIDDSLRNTSGEQDEQVAYLTQQLMKLSPMEIVGFRLRTDKLLFDTYNPEMWCAGYIMNGGCSDDGFEYFRLWMISRGRDVYDKAKADPDSLVDVNGGTVEDLYDFESFWYIANNSFQTKTGKDLYGYIDNENFKTSEANYPREIIFSWTEDDPESMKKICPKLCERFSHLIG